MPDADKHSFIDREIARVGLAEATLRHSPCEHSCIYVIDTMLNHPMNFRVEGPPAFSISIFLAGTGSIRMDSGGELDIRPGTAAIFISNRTTAGEHYFTGNQRIRCVDFRYTPAFFQWLGEPTNDTNPLGSRSVFRSQEETLMMGFVAPPSVMQIATDVAQRFPQEGAARRLFLTAKSIELLSRLPDLVREDEYPASAIVLARSRLERAREILSVDFANDWTIPKLSRHVGLNERKLKEGFRLLMGTTPHAYLRECRLAAAKKLLAGGATVTIAAHEVGFTNLSHFAKSFRERYGLSPGALRRHYSAMLTSTDG